MSAPRGLAHASRRAAAFVLLLIPCAAASADWTATGSFHYTNRLYEAGGYTTTEVRPIREADVEVIDVASGAILATGSTDRDGSYSLHVVDGLTRGVAVRVVSLSVSD